MASVSLSRCCGVIVMLMFVLGRTVSAYSSAEQNPSAEYHSGLSDESYYDNAYTPLSPYYFGCKTVLDHIRTLVHTEVFAEPRMGASLLRLHFHDCFVNGCDGSVLLDNTTATNGEKFAAPNFNSLRGFEVIDRIKAAVELMCPERVSCADILAVAARDSIELLSRYTYKYKVNLGRKDSKTASMSAANTNLPPPFFNLSNLLSFFANKGFTPRETVALSGGHTIGEARCATFRDRIYNDSNIDQNFATKLKETCPRSGGGSDLAPLDSTVGTFDNAYFKDLLVKRGLLHSDQELFNGGETDGIVKEYSANKAQFFKDFEAAMLKMGKLSPPAGTEPGEIRKDCRRRN